jgi:hypothetical protein
MVSCKLGVVMHANNPNIGRLRQEYHEFKDSLYYIKRLCLKKKKKTREKSKKNKKRKLYSGILYLRAPGDPIKDPWLSAEC